MPSAPEPRTDWMQDPKNVAIGLLLVTTLLFGGAVMRDRLAGLTLSSSSARGQGEPVSVLDVVLDRQTLRHLDFLLDRPVAGDRVGEVLGLDAATTRPALGGVWRWEGANILRFEPAGGFDMAMRYEFALVGERLLPTGYRLDGESAFEIVTAQFRVERVDLYQEPTPGGEGIQIRGVARFNYDVDPEALATRIRLTDPSRAEPVPLAIETYYNDRVISFRSDSLLKERAERDLTLTIDRELTPAEGNVALPEPFDSTVTLGSSETLAVWEVAAAPNDTETTLSVLLSSGVEPGLAGRYIEVEPAVDFRLGAARNTLLLTGDFIPGRAYRLRLTAGLPARDGAVLRADHETEIAVPDLEPRVGFVSQGMFLAAGGNRALAVESVNVDRATVAVERVYRNNLFYLFDSYGWMVWDPSTYSGSAVSHALGDRIADVPLRFDGARNRRRTLPLDLDPYLSDGAPGLYRVVLGRRGDYRAQQRWVLVTDLGIVAKQGERDLLVWVSSLSDLQPIAGARVTLMSDQNQPIASGRTDARGIWHPRDLPAEERGRAHMIVVERNADFSFLLLGAMGVDTTGLDVGGSASAADAYQAFMYGERDIYRPGETVEGVAVVRDRQLRPPPSMPLRLRHIDATGLERSTRVVSMEAEGSASFEVALPAFARTGSHLLELEAGDRVIGRYRFQVEEFVPDRIRVDIGVTGDEIRSGEALEFDVDAAYLFGPPASGLPVESRVRLEPGGFAPQGFQGYSFANFERQFPGQEVHVEEGVLGSDGSVAVRASLPGGLRVPSALRAVISARVQEEAGRGVTARRSVVVHPYPYYLGLRRAGSGYAEPGAREQFEVVAVDPAGNPATAGALRAEVFKDEWQTVLRRTPSGTFRYESTRDARLVASQDLAAGDATAAFSYTPQEFGAYRAVISDPVTGASAQVRFTASGFGFSPWAIANPARIELELDADEYRPGDTARVQVRAPFAGRLMLTVESDGVEESRVVPLDGNTATLDLQVRDAYRPNAYVTATVIRSASELQPGGVARAFGAVPLSVDRDSNRMSLTVEAPEEIRPGSRLTVAVDADPRGMVTVAAVDEGILQLIAQSTPDPFAFFYRKLALGVGSFDTFSLLFPEVEATAPAGGGAAADAAAQYASTAGIRRVQPVAFWSGALRADAQGRAVAEFDVPDFQGALRIMAVGHRGRRFGSGEAAVRVRDPIVLLPTVPRFLATDDSVDLPVSVRNDTGTDGTLEVTVEATVPGAAPATAVERVEVADGSERLLFFTIAGGGEPGEARVRLTASGLGEETSAEVHLPVRPALPARTTERVGTIEAGGVTLDAAGIAALRSGVERTVRVSAAPLVRLSGRLDYLLRYPYGCLEQVTSSAFPLVHLGDVAAQVAPDLFEGTDGPAPLVQEAIARLGTFQIFSGAFTLWPGGSTPQPWASVYATHFLVEARQAGYLVPDALYDRALAFVEEEARVGRGAGPDELQRAAYALLVTARAGRADVGTMDYLRQDHSAAMSAETRALLAAAYAAVGHGPAVEELVAGMRQVDTINRQTGGNFNSPVRNRALLLMGLLDAAPGDDRVTEVARRLARDADGLNPWSTQETAFALLALGRFYAREAQAGPIGGRVMLGSQTVGRYDAEGVEIAGLQGAAELRIVPDAGAAGGFFSLRTRGVPRDDAWVAEAQGLEVRRTFLSRSGTPVQLGDIEQGQLLAVRIRVRSLSGAIDNVVIQNLLPAGLEVENPRLSTTERLPWAGDANLETDHVDLRDDRILLFMSLPDQAWHTTYALVRAVTPGRFALPPVQAEAMYEPEIRASGTPGTLVVRAR